MKPTDGNYLNKYTRNGFFLLLNRTHFIGEIEDIEFLGDEIPLSVNSIISLSSDCGIIRYKEQKSLRTPLPVTFSILSELQSLTLKAKFSSDLLSL